MTSSPLTCSATGLNLSAVTVTASEKALVQTVANMLADPEWLLPIVAAHPQYRKTYYALTAAALLEDLWFDALANWVARAEPTTLLEKTPRGLPGAKGDYLVDGQPYSHKTGAGPQTTGVHWDALVAQSGSGLWTSPVPMVFLASGYGQLTGEWVSSLSPGPAGKKNARSVWPVADPPPKGRIPALLRWDPGGDAEVLECWSSWPSFEDVWRVVAEATAGGTPANHLEMLWVTAKNGPVAGETGSLVWTGRPAFFVFPEALLQNVPTSSNNRATTLASSTVLALMGSAMHLGLWTPMPMWHAAYAAPRPPDLYLAQRGEFDRRFSPAARP